ncbi:hypothetical protein J5N97_008937 [Dioscorea zingiberensis]|uniref:SANT domain-containing protein n=1 Tax=Dioscorea zingiberensis TaxID=325984 RepID=A0A9D5CXV4_9LILI|nr:hypothetical protein J5N97_008937 [Dioscorea zingiberensis]
MDLIEINYNDEVLNQQEECCVEISSGHIPSLDLPGVDDIYEDPSVAPRVGDMYQVEIPPLMAGSECLQLIHTPDKTKNILGVNYSIGLGSAIPIMWSECVDDHLKPEQQKNLCTDTCTLPWSVVNEDYKENLNVPVNNKGTGFLPHNVNQGISFKVTCPGGRSEGHGEFVRHMGEEHRIMEGHVGAGLPLWQPGKAKSCYALPDTAAAPWTAAESQSFLLGLYIFGKNLAQMRRFIGTKDMGDVLCFYYGKFYRSDAHRRWSECRKTRGRRCIHGSRIFTGWRQQELLSRLLPGISKDLQATLLEAVKLFNEGNSSFEEFIFTLKAMIGTEVLVEAVGIGKGKHDLTGIVLDPVRANQVLPIRSDIPVGKACSSLTAEDIIKFLTGNFRLSKARSNDLFWEAVWPRLLARGWHSEQPKDLGSFGSRNALVFLIPGVKKFSKRKLVKGDHYFDSVSDVLNKVALDPKLLELEVEGSGSVKDENGWDVDTQFKQNSLPVNQGCCYLRPRVPNCNSEVMKFTIVDTSWDQGEAPKKMRELRSLPADATFSLSPSKYSQGTERDTLSDEQDYADISFNNSEEHNPDISENKKMGNNRIASCNATLHSDVSDQLSAISKQAMSLNGHGSNNQLHDLLNEKEPFKDTWNQSSWQHNYLAPVVKRRRLNACKNTANKRPYNFPSGYQVKKEEISYESKPPELNENTVVGTAGSSSGNSFLSFPSAYKLKNEESSSTLKSLKRSEATSTETDSCRGKKLCHSSLADEGSRNESREYIFNNRTCLNDNDSAVSKTSLYEEKPRPHNLIDLNVPYLPSDVKSEEPSCTMELAHSHDDANIVKLVFPSETEPQLKCSQSSETSDGFLTRPDSTVNARRHSTRNRPLTKKALEAFACGFRSTKRRGGGTKTLSSRSSRRERSSIGEPSAPPPSGDFGFTSPNGLVSNVGISDEYRLYANHPNIFPESHNQPKGKEAHQS